jgi:hypothetical protein
MDYTEWEKMMMPELPEWAFWAKIFAILFIFGVITFMVYVWSTTIYIKRLFGWDLVEFFTWRPITSRKIEKDWNKIKKRLLTGVEAEFKLAVIEADILFGDVLARLNYEGKTLTEKIEKKPDSFSDADAIKAADRVYQDLVYDPSYSLEYPQAKEVILVFEKGLKDVQAFVEK